ncbi:DNA helicase [Tanacetum coccineum]
MPIAVTSNMPAGDSSIRGPLVLTTTLPDMFIERRGPTTSGATNFFHGGVVTEGLAISRTSTRIDDNRLPANSERYRPTTDIIRNHNTGDGTTVPISRIFDRFRDMPTSNTQPVFAARTGARTVYAVRNGKKCSTTALSSTTDDVNELPPLSEHYSHYVDIIRRHDTRDEVIPAMHLVKVIWDEAPMNDKRCFETFDRTFRDLMNATDLIFGGKTVVLGGDFRQTLPVKKGAGKQGLITASIAESHLWWHFKICLLTVNMRLLRSDLNDEEQRRSEIFAKWLLDVGNGEIGEPDEQDDQDSCWITIPPEYRVSNDATGMSELIDFIYDETTLKTPTAGALQEKTIMCSKNDTADAVNAKILSRIEGQGRTYISKDEAIPQGKETSETEMLYQMEYLKTITFPGFPPHELHLKVGSPIMLLRNVNLSGGLCNGTRMIVTSLMSKLIEARIITGTRVDDKVFIHRIPLMHKDPNLSFTFKRTQFPIKLCYAMTINKSQVQSLSRIGIYLPEPVFSHGQLLSLTMAENTIASLKIGQANCILEAKVYRKWIFKSIPEKKEIAFCCILIDKENNAIQANMEVNNVDYFNPLLKPLTSFGFHPFQFSYPPRKLTMEEMLYKFIDEGRREHEEMGALIREFKTTNKLLLKERNNSLSELEFEVYGLSKAINNAQSSNYEVKVLLNKLSSKEKDPGSFTIPCNIGHLHINNALADLGASISVMPYTMYEKLGLGEPKPTRMSLELADRSIQYPRGIAENVLIKIDKFILPIDFVILDMREDSKISIILGRPFLATARAMIDVFNKKITLRVGNKEVIFDVDQSIKRPPTKDDEYYGIDLLDTTIHSKIQELSEDDQLDSFLVSNLEESIDLSNLESYDKIKESRTPIRHIDEVNTPYSQETKNEHLYSASANEINKKRPTLKDLPSYLEYAYLKGDESCLDFISSKPREKYKISLLQVLEKRKGVIDWKIRMSFGLCNAPATFQRCMRAIFHDMVKDFMEVFMDDFSVFEGIVLGHKISGKGIEVDKAKIDVIAKLPYPSNVKGVRSFLGHAGFYRRFIKDFSMISKLMTQLLMKDTKFDFSEDLGAVLGQRIDRKFKPIYYASKTLNDSQAHYTTTEKELLAVVFSFDKFRPYLILSKTIVYTDHSALKYLFSKQDAKPRLIRWVLLLQGFNIEIKDKKGQNIWPRITCQDLKIQT